MAATAAQQQEYLNKLREQMQSQVVQEVMNKMSEKCFKLCVTKKSGSHLDSYESTCIVNCMDRYMETVQVVSKTISDPTRK
eukprot:gene23624-30635_t